LSPLNLPLPDPADTFAVNQAIDKAAATITIQWSSAAPISTGANFRSDFVVHWSFRRQSLAIDESLSGTSRPE
jgi:hypothetical protein